MNFKYHGFYCGPGWSDGQYKDDAAGYATPIDNFDFCCKNHDRELAESPEDRYQADVNFAKCAISAGRVDEAVATMYYGRLAPTIKTMVKKLRGSVTKANKNQVALRNGQNNSKALVVYKAPKVNVNDSKKMAPVSIATLRTGSAAQMRMTGDGSIRVKHRSFIKPVTCTSAFAVEAVAVNPGLQGSFPWVAKMARKYDLYRFVNLKYIYRSVAATSSSGVVMMSFDFDAADEPPASKSRQAQTIPNVETNAWSSLDLNVKSDGKWRFVRPGNLPANLDIKTYDLGTLFISGLYGPGTVTGELYVEYTVEFKKPSEGTEDAGTMRNIISAFNAPFSATPTFSGYFPAKYNNPNRIEFTSGGEWILAVSTIGTGITTSPSGVTFLNGGAITTLSVGLGATTMTVVYKIRCELGDILQFNTAGSGTTVTDFILRAAPIDFSLMT